MAEPSPANPRAIANLEAAYFALRSDPEASLPALEEAYFQLSSELARQGKREAIAHLKASHTRFKQTLLQERRQQREDGTERDQPGASTDELRSDQGGDDDPNGVAAAIRDLRERLRSRGLEVKVRVHQDQLQIQLAPAAARQRVRATAIIYTVVEQQASEAFRQAGVAELAIAGLSAARQVAWQTGVPMPLAPYNRDNRDLMSFRNQPINIVGFPLLWLVGIGLQSSPIASFLLRGIQIWFHELGHAMIAWLSGRRALPLPFGWTSVNPERSTFVYCGLLLLLGLMFWVGRREQQRWTMGLALALIGVQFGFTWLLPADRFETLLAFGGIGGEFYLCTLLMVSFFFPLPAYWRWDFYRYPVAIAAAFTFWGQFKLWHQIKDGLEEIPWGSMWGGPDHGDMNSLSDAGWSDQQIIATYTTLGDLCLLTLIGVYISMAIHQNRHYLFAVAQRWLARGA